MIKETRVNWGDARTLAQQLTGASKKTQEERGEQAWYTLTQIARNAPIAWEGADFIAEVLKPLLPFMPKYHVIEIWKQAIETYQSQHKRIEISQHAYNLAAIAPFLPSDIALRAITNLDPGVDTFPSRPKSEILMVVAQYAEGTQQEVAYITAWNYAVNSIWKFRPSELPLEQSWLDEVAKKIPSEIALKIWKDTVKVLATDDIFNSEYTLSDGPTDERYAMRCCALKSLSLAIPISAIPNTIHDCFIAKGSYQIAETIVSLITRAPVAQQQELVNQVMQTAFTHTANDSHNPLNLTTQLLQCLPEHIRNMIWSSVREKILSYPDDMAKGASLSALIEYVPADDQVEMWVTSWESVMRNKSFGFRELLKDLPQVFRRMNKSQIERTISAWNNEIWDDEYYIQDIFVHQEAFAILVTNSSKKFAKKCLKTFLKSMEKIHGNVLGGLLPLLLDYRISHLSDDQISYLSKRAIVSGEFELEQVQHVLPYWSSTRVIEMWKTVEANFNDDNDYIYGPYALTLVPYLPPDFLLYAFKTAIKLVSPMVYPYWLDICRLLIERLPQSDVSEAVRLLEKPESNNDPCGYIREFKEKLILRQ